MTIEFGCSGRGGRFQFRPAIARRRASGTGTGLGLLHLRPDCPSVSGVVSIDASAADLGPRGPTGGERSAKAGRSDTSRPLGVGAARLRPWFPLVLRFFREFLMILTGSEIKAQLGKNIVIDPFDERQLNPNSYNVRLHNELLVYEEIVLDMRRSFERTSFVARQTPTLVSGPERWIAGHGHLPVSMWRSASSLIPTLDQILVIFREWAYRVR